MFRLRRPRAVETVVVEDPLSALAAWWLFPYSSVAAVGGKSELASIDPAELPPNTPGANIYGRGLHSGLPSR